MSNQVMMHCKTCMKPTMHVQPSTSHVVHLLLSLLTGGLWIVIWIIVALNNRSESQCTICGATQGVFGFSSKGAVPQEERREYVICPECREKILLGARVCRFCGTRLSTTVVKEATKPRPGQPDTRTLGEILKDQEGA